MAMDFLKTVVVRLIYTVIVFLTLGKPTAAFPSDRNTPAEWAVRLVDDDDDNVVSIEGRVQVFLNGSWGNICFYNWDVHDAEVACRSLGFSGLFMESFSLQSKTTNVLFDVRCSGNESSLEECPHSFADEYDECWIPFRASVTCLNSTIRLTGGHYPWEGIVEVFYHSSWRTVCDDRWDINNGHVVCRYLGIGTALDTDQQDITSKGPPEYILNGISCNGNESSILECSWTRLRNHQCNSTRIAMVRCSTGIRLVGGRNSSEGRVEVFAKSTWGLTCGKDWTLNNAHVICKSLGFAGALKAFDKAEFGYVINNIHLSDAHCTGRENNIFDCPDAKFETLDTCYHDGAGVQCSIEDEVIYLTDGSSFLDGVVMYYYNGQQRSVCSDSWDKNDADVACRSLALGRARSITSSHISDGSHVEITLDRVECTGNESRLFDCPGVGVGSHENCNASEVSRVTCSGGNVCVLGLCPLEMDSQGTVCTYIESISARESDQCAHYENKNSGRGPFGLQCLSSVEEGSSNFSFGQILECQMEIEHVILRRSNITLLAQAAFSEMKNLVFLFLDSNMIVSVPDGIFEGPENLEFIDMSYNQITSISTKLFSNLPKLLTLSLEYNNIVDIYNGAFHGLPSLENLYLNNNNITMITEDVFSGTVDVLHIENNRIRTIEKRSLYGMDINRVRLQKNNLVTLSGIFDGLPELERLNLSSNDIKHIDEGDFQDQINLLILDLSVNPITRIDPGVFVYTIRLEYIFLLDLQLQPIRGNVLTGLISLKAISTSDNRLCCLLDQRENVTCARTSPTSPLETCGRLYPNVVLMIAGWVIGLTSLIGNLTVLVLRLRQEQQLTVQTLLVMNLAVADCLMGIYMIIITSADIYFGSVYFLSAPIWRESHLCTFSSFLAFLSSECSVFTLALMTVDRFVCIIFPFSGYRLTVKSARISMVLLWLVMCMLSVIPNLVPADLPGFYGLSDVCVGLPLHAESKEIGRLEFTEDFLSSGFLIEYVVVESTFRPSWLYAVATFIGVNMILFIIILICYIVMFIQVKRSTQSVANVALRNREIKVARKMAFIVGTDFACWMPIIVMGILTQSGLVVLPTSLYAWSVIFIIPINSSINPVLYTFVNYIENKKKAEQVRTKSKVDGMTAKRASVNDISLTELNNGGHL